MAARLLGAFGESSAAEYLRKKGYKILAMNYRCRFGEIDIIAMKRSVIVIAEVKTRKSGSWAPAADYVDRAKQRKLRLAAESWLNENADVYDDDEECRFDVIEVYTDESGRKVQRLNHIEEAF